MRHARDLTGQKFGRLLIVRQAVRVQTKGKVSWDCRCDCGTEVTVIGNNLIREITKSCGCFRRETNLSKQPKEVEFRIFQREAARIQRVFSLSQEQFEILIFGNCHYCGAVPATKTRVGKLRRNGIDRIDSSIGYEEKNCVTSCWTCNNMKGTLSVDEFLLAVRRIVQKQGA